MEAKCKAVACLILLRSAMMAVDTQRFELATSQPLLPADGGG
jgi:hypothetical protein